MEENKYNTKILVPQYVVRGGQNKKQKLLNLEKFNQLVEEIKNSENISEKQKKFLIYAATRHIEFNYSQIAEYYCTASPEMQNLMEKSALVIVDVDDAIANGYVTLTNKVQEIIDRRIK